MSVGKTRFRVALLLGVVTAVTAFAAGCGPSGSGPSASSVSSASPASASERAQAILGRAPTGLAETIVARGEVVVAVDADYAPQSALDSKTGKPVGFDVDVAEQVGRILGLSVRFRTAVLEMIPVGLKADDYDVAVDSIPAADPGETVMELTDPYYYTQGQIFVTKGGMQITSAADLAGKTVGVGSGTVFYPWLKENTEAAVKMFETDAAALQDLADGKLDFVMTASQTGQQAIQSGEPIEPSGNPLYYEDLAFAIKRGESDWLALLDHAVQQMHRDGALTTMSKKWFDGLDLTVKQ